MSNTNNKKLGEEKSDLPKLIQLEQEIISENPKLFEGISSKKKQELLRVMSFTSIHERTHSGPLPDAETLIKYDAVIPNGADRIMKMAEKQQEHRMEMEKSVILGQSSQSKLGQWFGLIIGIVGISCGTFLANNGETTVGGIIAGGTVVSLVSVFVIGKKIQSSKN